MCGLQRQEKESEGAAFSEEGLQKKVDEPAKGSRVLRTYGQKKAKVDPVSEEAQVLAPDVLALIAGKKRDANKREILLP